MAELKSPVEVIREELGLTRRDFALMCGMGYQGVYLVEKGYRMGISDGVAVFLEQLGYDVAEVEVQQRIFVMRLGTELREKFLADHA
jgi:hypothetical protein